MPKAEVTPLKVELRRVICDVRLYKDSFPFRAELWIDGVQYGTVENDNNGGEPIFRNREGEMKLREYAKTLPNIRYVGGGSVFQYPASADTIVSDLLTEWIVTQDLKKDMRLKWLYTIKGNNLQVFNISKTKLHTAEAFLLAHNGKVEHLLNHMEPLEAAKLMLAYENRKTTWQPEEPFVAVDKPKPKRKNKA